MYIINGDKIKQNSVEIKIISTLIVKKNVILSKKHFIYFTTLGLFTNLIGAFTILVLCILIFNCF